MNTGKPVNEEEKAQREARAREVRHEVVTGLTLSTHRTFAVLFAVQWPAALLLAWTSALPLVRLRNGVGMRTTTAIIRSSSSKFAYFNTS